MQRLQCHTQVSHLCPLQPPDCTNAATVFFYLRVITPKSLQTATGKREAWHSLRTKDPKEARVFALSYALELAKAQAGISMSKKKGNSVADLTEQITTPYKLDLERGIMEAIDGADHARMVEALVLMKEAKQTPLSQTPPPIGVAIFCSVTTFPHTEYKIDRILASIE